MSQEIEINGLRLYAEKLAERIKIVVDWHKVNDSKSLKETIYYLESPSGIGADSLRSPHFQGRL